jgi:aryl-alcohol dehydrogenase-like predicted oxidoreductase
MDTSYATAGLVLGTAQLGAVALRDAGYILRAALNAGVEWIDATAADVAEPCIAAALPGTRGVRIATKIVPIDDRDTGAVRRTLIETIRRSCSAFRTDRLDTLLLSDARHLTAHAGVVWQTVKRLRDEGVLFDLGVCAETPEEALIAIADPDVRHLQIAFTAFDRRWRASGVAQALAKRPEITVHARAAGQPHRIDPARIARLVGDLERESAIDMCVAYMRAQSWISGIIIDVDSVAELAQTHALFKRSALAADEIGIIDRTLASAPRLFRIA